MTNFKLSSAPCAERHFIGSNSMSASSSLYDLVRELERVYTRPFDPRNFVLRARDLLLTFSVEPGDVAAFVQERWDTHSCLPHLVDTDRPPYLIDLHVHTDWCLRATYWPPSSETEWRDQPHSHFGHIATTAITPTAYRVRLFDRLPSRSAEGSYQEADLSRGIVHVIHPETIHEVLLPEVTAGVSLSVRSRAVVSESIEYDPVTRTVRPRSKSASDRKEEVLRRLGDVVASIQETSS